MDFIPGHPALVYSFEGRLVHEGMVILLAYRLARQKPQTFTVAINDYGFELLSPDTIAMESFQRLLHSDGS